METQTKLLMTATRQVVDALETLQRARADYAYVKAQYAAIREVIERWPEDGEVSNAKDKLVAIAELDLALGNVTRAYGA